MKKSIVQELNGLAQSTVMNRSFITTVATDQVYDLRKSRINNLPNYKKEDLSGKLNFVVVFQGIQIERLSVEVEALRVKLKESERQYFNNGNYEVQIRELSEKCVSYEMEREEYRQQIEKMNMISQRLYDELEEMKRRYAEVDLSLKEKYRLEQTRNDELQQELEKWKARFAALENSKNREIEDIKMMMEGQRKSMIDREIRELQTRFDSERNMLQGENRKLRESLENRNSQNSRLQNQISRLEVTLNELRAAEEKLAEYENKIVMISQQTMRLNELLRARQEEIDRLRNSENSMKQKLAQNDRMTYDYNQLVIKAQQLEGDLGNWNQRYSRLEEENRRNQIQVDKIPEYERLLDNSGNEIDRLNQIIRDKINQVDNWKSQYSTLEVKYKENKEQKLPQLENKVNSLIAENDRINNVLKNRLGDLQQWKGRCTDLEKTIDKYIVLEQDKRDLEHKNNEHMRTIENCKATIEQLQQNLSTMREVEERCRAEQQKNQQLRGECDRLNGLVRGKSDECENMKRKVDNYEREMNSLKNAEIELNEYKKRAALMTQELDRINGVILQRTQEVQQLREHFMKIDAGIAEQRKLEEKLVSSVKQMEELIVQLDEARRETDFFQDKLVLAENQIRRLQGEVFTNNQEKETLNHAIQQKTQQLEQIQIEIREKENEVRKLRDVEAKFADLQNKTRHLESNYQELEKKHKSECSRAEEAVAKAKTLNNDIERLKKEGVLSQAFVTEFMNVKRQCELKDREILNLEHRFQAIERCMKALRSELEKQAHFGKENHAKWVSVGDSLNGVTEFVRKSVNMHNQLSRVAEENIQLESTARLASMQLEVTRLNGSSVGASLENSLSLNNFMDIKGLATSTVNKFTSLAETRRELPARKALEPIKTYQF